MQNQKRGKRDVLYTGETINMQLDTSSLTPSGVFYKDDYVVILDHPFIMMTAGYEEIPEVPDEEILRAVEDKNYRAVLSPIG